jgi:hypothetical protein
MQPLYDLHRQRSEVVFVYTVAIVKKRESLGGCRFSFSRTIGCIAIKLLSAIPYLLLWYLRDIYESKGAPDPYVHIQQRSEELTSHTPA